MNAPSTTALLTAVTALAAGTYVFRVAGPALKSRVSLGDSAQRLTRTATVVLLTAVIATAALLQAGSFAGIARPAGVLVAGVLAWRKAPFVVVVIAAAGTTALFRVVLHVP